MWSQKQCVKKIKIKYFKKLSIVKIKDEQIQRRIGKKT